MPAMMGYARLALTMKWVSGLTGGSLMRKSIKEFSIRATKQGKRRGRPSKEEWNASAIISYHFNRNRKKIEKKIMDKIIYGKAII